MTNPKFELDNNEAQILKDALYNYRETDRLGGDELSLLRRVSVYLGMLEADAKEIRG